MIVMGAENASVLNATKLYIENGYNCNIYVILIVPQFKKKTQPMEKVPLTKWRKNIY